MEEAPKLVKVFENINGEKEGRDVLSDYYATEPRLLFEWFGKATREGRFCYQLFGMANGLYVRVSWIPAPGYRWEEERLYKLVIPEEAEED